MIFFFFLIYLTAGLHKHPWMMFSKSERREGEGTGPRKNPLHFGADPDGGRNIFLYE